MRYPPVTRCPCDMQTTPLVTRGPCDMHYPPGAKSPLGAAFFFLSLTRHTPARIPHSITPARSPHDMCQYDMRKKGV